MEGQFEDEPEFPGESLAWWSRGLENTHEAVKGILT